MIYLILFYLLIYSFLGWITEVIYAFSIQRKYINRGFLFGPFCPIYGFGMVCVSLIAEMIEPSTFISSIILTFFTVAMVGTLLELVTGWALEALFHTKWWDYSDRRYNFKGYICLSYSLMWGIGGTVVLFILHPFIQNAILILPKEVGHIFLVIAYGYLIVDGIFTLKELFVFKNIVMQMHLLSDQIHKDLGTAVREVEVRREAFTEEFSEKVSELIKDINEHKEQLHEKLLVKFNGYISSIHANNLAASFKNELEELKENTQKAFISKSAVYSDLRKKIRRSHLAKAFPKFSSAKYTNTCKDIKKKDELDFKK